MGAWDEQYWPSKEEVDAWREERAALVAEQGIVNGKLSRMKGITYGDEKAAFKKRATEIIARLGPLTEKIKQANILNKQSELAEYGIDPNDPRTLLGKALLLIKKLNQQLKAMGVEQPLAWEDYQLLDGIDMYISYRHRSAPGKLAFVPAQVER